MGDSEMVVEKRRYCTVGCQPSNLCLLTTIGVTVLATSLLSVSIFTDFWEKVHYNASRIEDVVRLHNGSHRLTWLFNQTVARIVIYPSSVTVLSLKGVFPTSNTSKNVTMYHNDESQQQHSTIIPESAQRSTYSITGEIQPSPITMRHKQKENHIREQLKKIRHIERMTNQRYLRDIQHHSVVKPKSPDVESFHPPWRPLINQYHTDMKFVYLIPLHGGIWNLCLTLNDDNLRILREMGMHQNTCIEYMERHNDELDIPLTHYRHVQSRMHKLSMSCSMVCIILLGSAALLGFFGILKRQISAVLITGVMYILAALFAVFSLTIMHFKQNTRRDNKIILVDDDISEDYLQTRKFSYGWSMDLGWSGSFLMLIASILWLFLSKLMRYNPLSLS